MLSGLRLVLCDLAWSGLVLCDLVSDLILPCVVLSVLVLFGLVLCFLVLSCLVLPCHILSCLVLSWLVLSCLVLPWLVLSFSFLVFSSVMLSSLLFSSLLFSSLLFSSLLLSGLVLSCVVWRCLVVRCLVLSCLVLSCLVLYLAVSLCRRCVVLCLSCLVSSCLVLSCLVLSCVRLGPALVFVNDISLVTIVSICIIIYLELVGPPLMLIPYAACQHEWFASRTAAMTLKDEMLALLVVKTCIALVSSVFFIENTRSYYKQCCVRCGCPIAYTKSLPFGKGMDRCIAYSLCLLVDVLTTALAIGMAVLQAMANEMANPDPSGSFALRDVESGEARAGAPTWTTLPGMHMRPTDAVVRKDDTEFYDWVNTILTMPSVHTKVCVH